MKHAALLFVCSAILFTSLASAQTSSDRAIALARQAWSEREDPARADEAIRILVEAQRAAPTDAHIGGELGWMLLHLGQVDAAVEELRDALADATELRTRTRIHHSLGAALEAQGEPVLAMEQYMLADEGNPNRETRRRAHALHVRNRERARPLGSDLVTNLYGGEWQSSAPCPTEEGSEGSAGNEQYCAEYQRQPVGRFELIRISRAFDLGQESDEFWLSDGERYRKLFERARYALPGGLMTERFVEDLRIEDGRLHLRLHARHVDYDFESSVRFDDFFDVACRLEDGRCVAINLGMRSMEGPGSCELNASCSDSASAHIDSARIEGARVEAYRSSQWVRGRLVLRGRGIPPQFREALSFDRLLEWAGEPGDVGAPSILVTPGC